MDSLPICQIVLSCKKTNRKPYPKELLSYGDHLRKRRLDLDLSQPRVAKIINVTADSITNWELNRNEPQLKYIPKIISFLGYVPTICENPIKNYRIQKGLTQKAISKILGIDPSTLGRIENDTGKRISKAIKEKLQTYFYWIPPV
ncbi:MAG: helix-turn-helix transcriptional regulator [Bacteroidales bacterium]|nr:helix-turn-helix transcriptional regulator [Bacteroidales bacterium]